MFGYDFDDYACYCFDDRWSNRESIGRYLRACYGRHIEGIGDIDASNAIEHLWISIINWLGHGNFRVATDSRFDRPKSVVHLYVPRIYDDVYSDFAVCSVCKCHMATY